MERFAPFGQFILDFQAHGLADAVKGEAGGGDQKGDRGIDAGGQADAVEGLLILHRIGDIAIE